MSIPRRTFVRAGLLSALAAACLRFPPTVFGQKVSPARDDGDGFVIPYEAQLAPVFRFNHATFAPHLNTPFEITGGPGGPVTVMLEEIRECAGKAGAAGAPKGGARVVPIECFTLHFRGASEAPLPEGTYTFEHGALGRFQLFFTPAHDKQLAPVYIAVINHRIG